MEKEERYYMVLCDEKFVGFVTGYNLDNASEKLSQINKSYYIEGDYVLKPNR